MTDQSSHRLPRTVVPQRYRLELVPDLEAASFTGTSVVEVLVTEATSEVVCNAADLEVGSVQAVGAEGGPLDATVTLDEAAERATAAFGRALEPGRWELTYRFRGTLNDKLQGFYRSTYTGADGATRTLATTQFEATDARRAFPCWDEPDRKATFDVTLVVADGLTAISNGAVVAEEALGDGRRRVRFAETMPMSTYLVAFVVGEFDLTPPRDVMGVPVRIAAPPGRGHLTSFAMEAAEHSLTFLAGYFGLPYPSDKLDHVAIPDFAAGAMENLGCVTYRESALLVDQEHASGLELQRVATVVAHETAHMWFGDLVTMKWWNGIWLNEAFATFMELTTTDAMRPQWDVWTAFGAGKAAAMAVDSLGSTRPVEFPVADPVEAEAMFDLLTYQKGGSVLRMLEQYLGAEPFRAGISRYLAAHSHGNTETSDLWDAIEESSGAPVRTIMESWIFQGGHPVVSVERGPGGDGLVVSQRRFTYTGEDAGERWVVPLSLRLSVGGEERTERLLLDGASTTVATGGPVDWVVLNAGSWGFFRSAYSPELLDALVGAGLDRLSPLERMGLLNDTWAAVLAGRGGLDGWARLVRALGDEDDPDVWAAALAPMRLLESSADEAELADVQAFVRTVAGPAFARVGWDAAAGEPERRATTRARLLSALGTVGADPDVAVEAAARHRADRSGDAPLAPDLRTAVVNVLVASGGREGWEEVRRGYLGAANPQEQERHLYALPSAHDGAILLETLDWSMGPDVRNQNGGFVAGMVLASRWGGEPAWAWVEDHWDALVERYRRNLLVRLLDGVTGLVGPGLPARTRAWLEAHDAGVGAQRVAQILERQDVNAAFAARARGTLGGALRG